MSTPDSAMNASFDTYLSYLLDRAEAQGFLTLDDVLEILPATESETVRQKQSESLCQALYEAGVTVCLDPNDPIEELFIPDESDENDSATDQTERDPSDTIGLYLHDMARVPLLTLDQEVALAQKINAGRCAERALESDVLLSGETIDELLELAETGLEARDELIRA